MSARAPGDALPPHSLKASDEAFALAAETGRLERWSFLRFLRVAFLALRERGVLFAVDMVVALQETSAHGYEYYEGPNPTAAAAWVRGLVDAGAETYPGDFRAFLEEHPQMRDAWLLHRYYSPVRLSQGREGPEILPPDRDELPGHPVRSTYFPASRAVTRRADDDLDLVGSAILWTMVAAGLTAGGLDAYLAAPDQPCGGLVAILVGLLALLFWDSGSGFVVVFFGYHYGTYHLGHAKGAPAVQVGLGIPVLYLLSLLLPRHSSPELPQARPSRRPPLRLGAKPLEMAMTGLEPDLEESGVVRVLEASGTASCPYCATSLELAGALRCATCETPHHGECWSENRGCTTYACTGAPDARTRLR